MEVSAPPLEPAPSRALAPSVLSEACVKPQFALQTNA
jgi:hypothetical protein